MTVGGDDDFTFAGINFCLRDVKQRLSHDEKLPAVERSDVNAGHVADAESRVHVEVSDLKFIADHRAVHVMIGIQPVLQNNVRHRISFVATATGVGWSAVVLRVGRSCRLFLQQDAVIATFEIDVNTTTQGAQNNIRSTSFDI